MSPELSDLFHIVREMAPNITETYIVDLQTSARAEIEYWKAREQQARERAASLAEEHYGPSAESHPPSPEPDDVSDAAHGSDDMDRQGEEEGCDLDNEDGAEDEEERKCRKKKPKPFPPLLDRDHHHHHAEPGACDEKGCNGEMKSVGEPRTTEILCLRRASWYIRRDHYHNLKCSCCGHFRSAKAPKRLFPGSRYDTSFVIDVIISKFCDFLPFYRQSRRLRRAGIDIDRSTLARLATSYAEPLYILQEKMLAFIKSGNTIDLDETRVPVLAPGNGQTATYWAWAYLRDDRRWDAGGPAAIVFDATPSRSGEYPADMLQGFSGKAMVDGFPGYNRLTDPDRAGGPIELVFCNAHARRKFSDAFKVLDCKFMREALSRYRKIYRLERMLENLSPKERRIRREQDLRPLFEDFQIWCEDLVAKLQKSSMSGKAVRYFLKHYPGLTLFLEDGELEIDNNSVENAMRAIAVLRKNALFAGSELGAKVWMAYASIVRTCEMNNIDPQEYLTWFYAQVAQKLPLSRYDELLPWKFRNKSGSDDE